MQLVPVRDSAKSDAFDKILCDRVKNVTLSSFSSYKNVQTVRTSLCFKEPLQGASLNLNGNGRCSYWRERKKRMKKFSVCLTYEKLQSSL